MFEKRKIFSWRFPTIFLYIILQGTGLFYKWNLPFLRKQPKYCVNNVAKAKKKMII